MEERELTRKERAEIRKLVTTLCANYDKTYDCCPLLDDYGCYMLCKRLADKKLCKYFQNAILPENPILQAVLTGKVNTREKPCAVCGSAFIPNGRQIYCSPGCKAEGMKRKERHKKRIQRENKGANVPI